MTIRKTADGRTISGFKMKLYPGFAEEYEKRHNIGQVVAETGMINAKMKREQPNASTAMAAVTELPKIASKAVRKEILVNSLIESPRSGR